MNRGSSTRVTQARREFLVALSLAGAAGLLRAPLSQATEGTLETTTVRFARNPAICIAPEFPAEGLLRAEGFTDIRYVDVKAGTLAAALARGDGDFSGGFAPSHVHAIDVGLPIVVLGGVLTRREL